MYWSADDAALTVVKPLVHNVPSGAYLIPMARVAQSSKQAMDESLAQELWEASTSIACKVLPQLNGGRTAMCGA